MTAKMWDTAPPVTFRGAAAALKHAGVAVLVLNHSMEVLAAHGALDRCIGTAHIDVGLPLLEVMPPAAHAAWQAAHASVVYGGMQHAALEMERNEHGSPRYVAFDLSPAPDPTHSGEDVVVCVGRDVTVERLAEQRGQHTMAAAVHELRTPITVLRGYAQLALKNADTNPHVRLLQLMNEQSERVVQVLDKWVDTVRVWQGNLRLLRGPVDLVALVEDVVRTRRHDVSDRVLQVLHEEPITVQADRRRLHHALLLLLNTALKYSPANSPIQICVNGTPTAADVVIHDHGTCVPAAHARSVWEPWYYAPNEPHRQFGGMGFGLHVAKHIVEQHGGQVSVAPGNDGGNVWTVHLPLGA